MGDPLSIAAGIAGLLSLGIQVCEPILKFYTAIKDQGKEIARTAEKFKSVLSILKSLENALRSRNYQSDEKHLLQTINHAIGSCKEVVAELQDEWRKIDIPSNRGSGGNAFLTSGRRAIYPFRQSTLHKLNEGASEIIQNLSLALDVLQLNDRNIMHSDLVGVVSLLEQVRNDQASLLVRDWLKAPDAAINYNLANAKRHHGTGMWFIKGNLFEKWLINENSFLWLNGFAGCGKSVLCSTAIEHTFRQKWNDPANIGVAFFFFAFNDESKQDASGMIRALLLQLSEQHRECRADLDRLHRSYHPWMPTNEILVDYLRCIIRRFQQVYIFLDALDESPRSDRRDTVLEAVRTMREWGIHSLHLLVTGRDEPDIHRCLTPAPDEIALLKNDGIINDIKTYISHKLKTSPDLQRWERYHDLIQHALLRKCQGVFRYVECQFSALKRCPRTKSHLINCLNSLPHGLDETYERMLCNISESCADDARRILTLICFSSRALTLTELIDAHAVDLNGSSRFSLEDRRLDVESLLEICSGLLQIVPEHTDLLHPQQTQTVRIAHYSVQEYLQSERIKQQKAAVFSLQIQDANALITQICLAYLLQHQLSDGTLDEAKLRNFPFADYAAEFWYHHCERSQDRRSQYKDSVLALFGNAKASFSTWVRLFSIDTPWRRHNFKRTSNKIASPIYYASFLGLDWVLDGLLPTHNQIRCYSDDNAGILQSVSRGSNESLVQLLPDEVDDVNKRGGYHGYALQAASYSGHDKIVQMLLNYNANISAEGGKYSNALQAASLQGHSNVVQMLINVNANVNAQGGYFGTALQAATYNGHEQVVQILLNHGASVNVQSGKYGTALQAASLGGYIRIVLILLDKHANVNVPGGEYGNALQAASLRGHISIFRILLDHGCDFNAQDGRYGNALQAASLGGHVNLARILLEKGADVNTQGGQYGNALQAALSREHHEVVQLLISWGANIHSQGGHYGNALQAASLRGLKEVVQILVDQRVDVNAQGGKYGNALQAASHGGHAKVVEILLSSNADVKAQRENLADALRAASQNGHDEVVRILLDAGMKNHQALVNQL